MRRVLVGLLLVAMAGALSVARIAPAAATTAPLDAALVAALGTAGPSDHVLAVAELPAVPSAADLSLLRSTGAAVIGYQRLPMAAVSATPLQIQALAGLPIVRSMWGNHSLELYLHESTAQIQANDVWAAPYGFTGRGVGVAVLDAGIDGTHPDLHYPEHVIQNVKILGFQQALPSASFPVEDIPDTDLTSGHGTHVAGIIAASGAASNGYYKGVAPGADVIGLGSGEGVELLTALGGFDYVLKNKDRYHIKVMNNSWGDGCTGVEGTGLQPTGCSAADPNDPLNVASKAVHDSGVTVVFAAGNDGQGADVFNRYARWPWVISVGSVNKHSVLESYSSEGTDTLHAQVMAPGGWITSDRASGVNYSTTNSTPFDLTDPAAPRMIDPSLWQYYTNMSGTSMAAPHVTGEVALILEANPNLTPDQVQSIVVSTATPIPGCPVRQCGAGVVNALAAVQAALAAANQAPVARLTASATSGAAPLSVTLDASASSDADGSVASYQWDTDGDGLVDTTGTSAIVTHVFGSGVFHPSVRVVDDRGLASAAISVEIRASNPPHASVTAPTKAKAGQTVTFDASASADSDGSVVGYTFTWGDGTSTASSSPVATHVYAAGRSMVFGWSVRVTDDAGLSDAVSGSLKVTP